MLNTTNPISLNIVLSAPMGAYVIYVEIYIFLITILCLKMATFVGTGLVPKTWPRSQMLHYGAI